MKNDNTKGLKRKDKKGRILRTGETQDSNGRYRYSYTINGEQKSTYSWKLEETDRLPAGKRPCVALRTQEAEIQKLINARVAANKMTALELVQDYLKTHDVGLKRSTKLSHKYALQNMQKDPKFCNQKIVEIRIGDVKKFFLRLAETGMTYGNILILKSVVFPAFQEAFEDELIVSNPCSFRFSRLMRQKNRKKEALTKEQMNEYLDFVKKSKKYPDYWEPLYIMFHTGMRVSEFCGLTIRDVDFQNNEIHINKQLRADENGILYVETPKTECGNRILPMTGDVAACLKVLVAEARKRKIQLMVDGVSGFLLYTKKESGTNPSRAIHPLCGDNWTSRCKVVWKDFVKANPDTKIPHVSPHVCRHTYCSQMAAAGMPPKVLQTLMGHADISTTMDVYAHLSTEDVKDAIARIVG